MTDEQYVLEIDGGASKTKLTITSSSSRTAKSIQLPSSNPNHVGWEHFAKLIERIAAHIPKTKRKHTHVRAGFAGIGRKSDRIRARKEFLKYGFPARKLEVMSDGELVLTKLPNPCVLVICGTGSVCYARSGEKTTRSGGWGYLLVDTCSAWGMGRLALKAASRFEDGRAPRTVLHKWFLDAFSLQELSEVIPKLYGGAIHPRDIAQIAPFIMKHCQRDWAAREIVDQAVNDVLSLVESVTAKFGKAKAPLYFTGGLTKSKIWRRRIEAKVKRLKFVSSCHWLKN